MLVRTFALYSALFLSGAAALVYQSMWGRMLQRVFGVSDLAIATVLAAFFLGLGLGNALAARWAHDLKRPAWAYAILEGGIGAYALASLALVPRVHGLYASLGADASFATLTALRLSLALAILLPPTILMGATLPVVVQLVARAGEGWAKAATWTYAANTFGAVLGAGAAGLWLVPTLGGRTTLLIAAAASVASAVLVRGFFRDGTESTTVADPPTATETANPTGRATDAGTATDTATATATETGAALSSPALAMSLAALAGFTALASEVLWTRVLRIIVQGTTQAFAAMLVNYLAGIAIGSLLAERLVRKGRSPARMLAVFQIAVALASVLAMLLTPQLPRLLGLLRGEAELAPHEVSVILAISGLLLFPLALAIGGTVPLAWRIAGGTAKEASVHTGRVLAANTFGGLIGSLAAGFLLVPAFGVEASILATVMLNLVVAGVALRSSVGVEPLRRILALTAPIALGVLLIRLGPSIDLPFLLNGRTDPVNAIVAGPGEAWKRSMVFLREGRNTTVTILRNGTSLSLFNDGRPESGFDVGEPGFGPELVVLGTLGTLTAAHHDRAMVIGLGGGHSAAVMLGGPWKRLDVVELEEAVVDAARLLYETRRKRFPLDDPRARLIIDDARTQLVLAPPGTYDAIVSQPSHPWLAGSSALYTKEFFEEVRRALRPGGVFALWVNLFRIDVPHVQSVVATLLTSFPNVQGFIVEGSSIVLVAGDEGLRFDRRAADRLEGAPGLSPFLTPFAIQRFDQWMALREFDAAGARLFARGGEVMSDDRPALEFDLARIPSVRRVTAAEIDRSLASVPWISEPGYEELPDDERLAVLEARVDRVGARMSALVRVERGARGLDLEANERSFVEGLFAEARGDVAGALARYDAAPIARAAERALRLRFADGQSAEILSRYTTLPPGTSQVWETLVRAAARAGSLSDMQALLDYARARGADMNERWLASLADLATRPCAELFLPASRTETAARDDLGFASHAVRCARERGDAVAEEGWADTHSTLRRASAIAEAGRGNIAATEGNERAAETFMRRALRYNPAHSSAAGVLARILKKDHRDAEAARVVRDAFIAARHLPQASQSLAAVAAELRIDLGAGAALPSAPSMASTVLEVPAPAAPLQSGE